MEHQQVCITALSAIVLAEQKEEAESCCLCSKCKKAKKVQYRTLCEACALQEEQQQNLERIQREKDILDKAVEVTECEYLWYNDMMYSSDDDLGEDVDVLPEYVHVMKPVLFHKWSLTEYIDRENENIDVDDYNYDISQHVKGLPELKEAFNKFNVLNKDVVIYYVVDYTKKIKLR